MENINALIGVLDKQTAVYNDLLEISKNKTPILIEGKVKELESVTKVEQALIFKMGDLEDELEQIVEKVKIDLSLDHNVTMSSIIDNIQGEQKEKLKNKTIEMLNIVTQLDHNNKLNSKLIKSSLDYIDFSMNLYSNAKSSSNGSYEESGNIKGNKSSFFDIKT